MYVEPAAGAPELEATIQSMEVAFRMQTEAPEYSTPQGICGHGGEVWRWAESDAVASPRAGW
jgi:hypothetical protein